MSNNGSTGTRTTVPVVDFGPFLENEGTVIGAPATAGQLEVARQMDEACRGSAFLYLRNCGFSPELVESAFAASKVLFQLEGKATQLARINPSTNMGYSPLFSENLNRRERSALECKEAFNVRWPPKHANNFQGCPSSFVQAADRLREQVTRTARLYCQACALALDLPTDFFAKTFETMDLCTIRFLHYPPYFPAHDNSDNNVEDGHDVDNPPARIGEHTDFGLFTFLLLLPQGADGLQIKPGGNDETTWLDVILPEDKATSPSVGILVNTGALMARWTNDYWRATAHRVVIQNADQARRDRYSIACFLDPDAATMVSVHDRFSTNDGIVRYRPISSMDFLLEKLQSLMHSSGDDGIEEKAP